jgi:hypothetical protein
MDTAKVSPMIEHAVTPAVLPARYGDCLLIQCPVGEWTWRMLADTVSDETLAQLEAGLAALPFDADGKRDIDLFIEPRLITIAPGVSACC